MQHYRWKGLVEEQGDGKWVESCNGSFESRGGCETISQYCIYMAELVEPTGSGTDRHFRSWKISLIHGDLDMGRQNIFYRFERNDFKNGNIRILGY